MHVFLWTIEVEVPHHHQKMQRWEVIIVDQTGKKMIHDYSFQSREEADAKAIQWIETHPHLIIHRLESAIFGY